MLSSFGIAEVARTGQPAVIGTLSVTVEDIIRQTSGPDWDDWLTLKSDVADRLASEMEEFVRAEHGWQPDGPKVIEGLFELVSVES